MMRYIELQDDYQQLKQLSTDDLPFEIIVFVEAGSENSIKSILITQINNTESKKIIEDENKHKKISIAYIASDEDYLFLQPDSDKTTEENIKIFHNNEVIKNSVWLKSGDAIQIDNKIIHYDVSGDIIKIKVIDRPAEKSNVQQDIILTPPLCRPSATDIVTPDLSAKQLETKQDNIADTIITNRKMKKGLIILSSLVLLLMLFFVLFSQTVQILIQPVADKMELSGTFPVVKLSERYILISGQYHLKAEKDGYKKINESILVDAEHTDFLLTMKEKPGRVSFNIAPGQNNSLYLDGVLLGDSRDNKQYEIENGEHTIVVSNKRYKKLEQQIQVKGKNKEQTFTIKLEPNWGQLKINSPMDKVSIKIITDNNNVDMIYEDVLQEDKEYELITGAYTLIATKDKYKKSMQKFIINALENKIITLPLLEPEDAVIHINSEPAGAFIRLDDQFIGNTPLSVTVSANKEHEIELSLSDYKTIKKRLILQPEEVTEKNFKLDTLKGIVFISVSPTQAKLFIDGKQQKKTSGKFSIGANNHVITVKAKGYKTQSKKINASQYSKNLSFNLIKINTHQIAGKGKAPASKNKKIPIKKQNYSNKIAQKMILMKPVSFIMGSKKNEAGRGSNEREYPVRLDYSYYLSEKEITNRQFRQFKATHTSGMTSGQSIDRGEQPVVNVSWNEAAEFANWLSKKEGLKAFYKNVKGKMQPVNLSAKIHGYRLPFEAEWALAARGTKRKKYPWSGSFPPVVVSGNFADESARNYVANIIEGYNDQHGVSAPVGTYKINAAGFYDLGGNVSEWCQNYYSPYSGISGNKTIINPTGPQRGTHKVVRDSSWRDASITELRLAYRSYSKKKAKDIGFRLARYAQ